MAAKNFDDDQDREKLSWRERDALKNKSRHLPKEDRETRTHKNLQMRKDALAKQALDALFKPQKNKDQEAAWKKMSALRGKEFEKSAAEYIVTYGMPKEWDDLLRLLDHENADFLVQILDRLQALSADQTKAARELALGKLKILNITHEDPKVLTAIAKTIPALEKNNA